MEVLAKAAVVPLSTQKGETAVVRRSANFHPCIWGDYFLSCTSEPTEIDINWEKQVEELKKQVKQMILETSDKPSEQLNLIDTLQRLGVSYHFKCQINAALEQMKEIYPCFDQKDDYDFHTVSLGFRLLRQHGHNVSSDVFYKFMDNNGKFKDSLVNNVRGMLSLYEATHLRVHGEHIMDEALDFATIQLGTLSQNLRNTPLGEEVIHALEQPIHKGLARLEARNYISIYQKYDFHSEILLKFAKLDFNRLQKMHQVELISITRWWKNLDFARKLPFARDRIVECYFWVLGVYFEPQYLMARRMVTKVIAMTSIIDDIYDVYGTLEEITLFTHAIERWDVAALDQLPDYMKLCYQALLDVYSQTEDQMVKEGKSYRVHFAKTQMKRLVRAYYEEARWYHEGYVPKYKEYMKVALVTGAYIMLIATSFVGMGEIVTKEAFLWVSNDPLMVRAASVICRLSDDMVGHEFEQERGHLASAVECYMCQYGVTKKAALSALTKKISNAWKDINQECLHPNTVPMPLLTRVLNLARAIYVMYKDVDGYTHSKTRTKKYITTVLIDPVPM